MRTVIAGGAGFIGSHFCDRLLAMGHEVTCLDNFVTGRRANIAHLAGQSRFQLIEWDVCEPFPASVEGDWFLQLASPASPPRYLAIPVETLLTNATGTQQMLERAAACRGRFLLASTSEVYGNPLEHPQSELYWGNVSSTGPRSCYDEGKRYAEALTMAFHRSRGLDVRIARIFNTYGPRMNPEDGRALPNFVVQAVRGEPFTIYGDGTQTRSFCYISDLIDGFIAFLEHPDAAGQVVNLGNPIEVDMTVLVQRIQTITGASLPIVYEPMPPDDPLRRRPDIRKAKALLGWEPRVGLDEGLARTIDWFREELATPPHLTTEERSDKVAR